MNLPVYIDIDGTLTNSAGSKGDPIPSRLDVVRGMIKDGTPVVLWSSAGCEYAKTFADENNLDVTAAVGKPDYCIDDMKSIKWDGLKTRTPAYLDVLGILGSAKL